MGQSSFKWVITLDGGVTFSVISTQENLPNAVDFSGADIVSIVRLEFA